MKASKRRIGSRKRKAKGYRMNDAAKKIADSFSCRYKVFEKGTEPKEAERAYKLAYESGRLKGFWPALLVLNEYVEEWLSYMAGTDYDKDALIAGCKEDGGKILQQRYQAYVEELGEEAQEDLIGAETQGEQLCHFSGYVSFTDRMLEADTLLLEIPVKHPWEIIGYLPMGGWNDCPAPEEMIAVCRYWYETYQAVPAVFTNDVMEFYAPFGLNGIDSLKAAKEHFAFCTDRVFQGTRSYTLSELAAGLSQSNVWYFWWD